MDIGKLKGSNLFFFVFFIFFICIYMYIYTLYQETGRVRDGLYFVKVILSDILIQSGKDDLLVFS